MSYNNGSTHDKSMTNSYTIEFANGDSGKSSSRHQSRRKILGSSRAKPPPSKWDDAQKWLTGFSGGGGGGGGGGGAQHKCKPRNSNADDRRLLPSHSQRARDSCSSIEGALDYDCAVAVAVGYSQEEGETKKIDCNELFLKAQNRNPNPVEESVVGVRSVFLRDMGTEMTPIASKEPSRTGTPMRASTPISSRSSTPGRVRQGGAPVSERSGEAAAAMNYGRANGNGWVGRGGGEADCVEKLENSVSLAMEASSNSLESRAMAWDEAERAKYMARCLHSILRSRTVFDSFRIANWINYVMLWSHSVPFGLILC